MAEQSCVYSAAPTFLARLTKLERMSLCSCIHTGDDLLACSNACPSTSRSALGAVLSLRRVRACKKPSLVSGWEVRPSLAPACTPAVRVTRALPTTASACTQREPSQLQEGTDASHSFASSTGGQSLLPGARLYCGEPELSAKHGKCEVHNVAQGCNVAVIELLTATFWLGANQKPRHTLFQKSSESNQGECRNS
jgi:hypothetical protein